MNDLDALVCRLAVRIVQMEQIIQQLRDQIKYLQDNQPKDSPPNEDAPGPGENTTPDDQGSLADTA